MDEKFKNKLETCSEHELYFIIDECGAFIFRMSHDLAHGRIDSAHELEINNDINNIIESQREAVKETIRFGVPFKMVEIDGSFGKSEKACEEYWTWYRHWDSWKKGLSEENWRIVRNKMAKNESIEEFLPSKKWNE